MVATTASHRLREKKWLFRKSACLSRTSDPPSKEGHQCALERGETHTGDTGVARTICCLLVGRVKGGGLLNKLLNKSRETLLSRR